MSNETEYTYKCTVCHACFTEDEEISEVAQELACCDKPNCLSTAAWKLNNSLATLRRERDTLAQRLNRIARVKAVYLDHAPAEPREHAAIQMAHALGTIGAIAQEAA